MLQHNPDQPTAQEVLVLATELQNLIPVNPDEKQALIAFTGFLVAIVRRDSKIGRRVEALRSLRNNLALPIREGVYGTVTANCLRSIFAEVQQTSADFDHWMLQCRLLQEAMSNLRMKYSR